MHIILLYDISNYLLLGGSVHPLSMESFMGGDGVHKENLQRIFFTYFALLIFGPTFIDMLATHGFHFTVWGGPHWAALGCFTWQRFHLDGWFMIGALRVIYVYLVEHGVVNFHDVYICIITY
jgi:hypothetical protein